MQIWLDGIANTNKNIEQLGQLVRYSWRFCALVAIVAGGINTAAAGVVADGSGLFKVPIIIPGPDLAPLYGCDLKKFTAMRFVKRGKKLLEDFVPLQFDQRNTEGNYVLPNGLGYTRNSDDGLLDDNDELSFMGTDTGDQAPKTHPDFGSRSVYEIQLTDPTTKKQQYFYLVYDPIRALPRSHKYYVAFDPKKNRVVTLRYEYIFQADNYLLPKTVRIGGQNILSEAEYLYYFDIPYFPNVTFRSSDFRALLEEWRVGPIRAILAIGIRYKVFFMEVKTSLFSEISFFLNQVTFPTVVDFPVDGSKVFNPGTGIYYGFNFFGATYDTNLRLLTKVAEMKQINQAGLRMPYIKGRQRDTEVFVRLNPDFDKDTQKILEPQVYDRSKNPSKAVLKSRSWLADTKTPLGIYVDLSGAKKRKYTVVCDFFFENRRYAAHGADYFKNYQKPTVKVRQVQGQACRR